MNYTIKISDDELRLLKSITRDEYMRVQSLHNQEVSRAEANSIKWLENRSCQLLLLIGKLDNVITVADKITVE